MKNILILLSILSINLVYADTTCPLMIGEENDPEETVTVEGKTLGFCCGSCVSKFEDNKAYYVKAVKHLHDLFTPEQRKALGVDDVVLLQQKRCPIYPERIVNPNCPTVEYKLSLIHI